MNNNHLDIEKLRAYVDPAFIGRESAISLLPKNGHVFPKMRTKPCDDCAVMNGMYAGLAACGYRHLNPSEKQRLVDGWDCHNGGRCEGAARVLLD